MKIIVASDNHGDKEILDYIVRANPDASLFLHLGDSQLAPYELGPFVSVKGNNDYGMDYPYELYFDTPYGKLYMHHGNFMYGVTPFLVEQKKCMIFLYGHIHRKRIQKFKDVYVVCPGSTSLPRGNDTPSYLVIEFNEFNEPIFNFKNL